MAFAAGVWGLAHHSRLAPPLATATSALVAVGSVAAFSAARHREVWQDRSTIRWAGPLVAAALAVVAAVAAGWVWWGERRGAGQR